MLTVIPVAATAAPPLPLWLGPAGAAHLFSLPELASGHARALAASGGRFFRALAPAADGAFPELHDSHTFAGVTSSGLYVNFSAASIARATTLRSDDYLSLLDVGTVACEGGDDGALLLRLAFPAPLAAAEAEAFAHLLARASQPGAHLLLGAATLLRHPAPFAPGGGCAPPEGDAGAPPAPPVFSLRVEAAVSPAALSLRLTPAPAAAAFAYLSVALTVGAARPARVGEAAARRASALAVAPPTFDLGVNYDPASGGAAAGKLQFFPDAPGALLCEGCFFLLRGALSVSLLVCAVARREGLTYYYDATSQGAALGGLGYYGGAGGACAQGDGAGCKTAAAGGDAAARAATDCAPPPGGLGTGLAAGGGGPALDLGLRVSAAWEGAAAFRFALRSEAGFAGASAAFPLSCGGDGTAACTRGALPGLPAPAAGPAFSLSAGALPISVAPSLALESAAAAVGAAPALLLHVGVEGAAPAARLGGSVALASAAAGGAPVSAAVAEFSPALCATPYSLGGVPTSGGIRAEATLAARLRIVVGGLLAFSAAPAFTLRQVAGAGVGAGAVACSAGKQPAAASAGASLAVAVEAAFLVPLARAFAGVAVPGAADALAVPGALLLDPATAPLPAAGAVVAAAAAACLVPGVPLAAAATCAAPPARSWWGFVGDNRGAVAGGVVGAAAVVGGCAAAAFAARARAARARARCATSAAAAEKRGGRGEKGRRDVGGGISPPLPGEWAGLQLHTPPRSTKNPVAAAASGAHV